MAGMAKAPDKPIDVETRTEIGVSTASVEEQAITSFNRNYRTENNYLFTQNNSSPIQSLDQLLKSDLIDSTHKELLKRVLKDNKQELYSIDKNGKTLEQHLLDLVNSNTKLSESFSASLEKNPEQVRQEILHNLIERIHNKGYAEQSNKASCVLCSTESILFTQSPSEYTRIIIDLATIGGTQLKSGEVIKLNEQLVATVDNAQIGNRRDPPRDLISRMFQETMAEKLAEKAGGEYTDPSKTIWTTSSGIRFQGFTDSQTIDAIAMVTGKEQGMHYADSSRSELMEKIRSNKGLTSVVLNWGPPGTTHSRHAVSVIVKGDKVYMFTGHHTHKDKNDPLGKTASGPDRSLYLINDDKTNGHYAAMAVMDIKDFEARLYSAILPVDKFGQGAQVQDIKTSDTLNTTYVIDVDGKPTYILNPTSETQNELKVSNTITNLSPEENRRLTKLITQVTPELAENPDISKLSDDALKALEAILLWHYRTKILGEKHEKVESDLNITPEKKPKTEEEEPAKDKPKQ